ncbi:MAG: hypothetical protein PHC34_00360 [Candidatus Gastranaerophilales bacterium]|nr:hypothetical protein [Candidatus Gastranaerophilales bacterium]
MYLNSIRVKTGITILILLTVFSNIYNSFKLAKTFPDFLKIDNVTVSEIRLVSLKNYLKNVKEVGYITELENTKGVFAIEDLNDTQSLNKAIDVMAQLILTQYTLCPVFVYNQTNLPLVVGNFPKGLSDRNFFIKKNLIPVKKFPNGVILLKNKAQ